MRLGIMQGRLSPPVDDHYQEFPDNWEKEFLTLNNLSLIGVEWLITKKHYIDNPILEVLNSDYSEFVSSICMDNLVDSRIADEDFLKEMLDDFCFKINNKFDGFLTIPLLDESDLTDSDKRFKFGQIMKQIGVKYPNLKFAFEAEMSIEGLQEIVELCDNFYVTYDTGNITSFGLDHKEYIMHFAKKIVNVHLKDRTYDGQTVMPTDGDTDFKTIFKTLKKVNYSGPFILQSARQESGKEKETIFTYKQLYEKLFNSV
tara:strand:- start:6753 stop:7526 length:774 start_codon:yes stop_codon:yes gene_type:complete